MDLASLVGTVLAIGMVIFGMVVDMSDGFAINIDSLSQFIDIPSILIVIGGTVGALLMSFQISNFSGMIKHIMLCFLPQKWSPEKYIEQIVEFATKARVNGLLALEEDLNNVKDEFLKNSLMMVVDSVEPEKVKQQLESQLDSLDDRHGQVRAFYDKGAGVAPAFGMIGTVVGLILMLADLSDVATLGPKMAVALVTTLYGSLMANIIFGPISAKLGMRHDEEMLCKMLISEGVQSIQAGENPKFIQEKLTRLLPASSKAAKKLAQAAKD